MRKRRRNYRTKRGGYRNTYLAGSRVRSAKKRRSRRIRKARVSRGGIRL